MRPTPTTLSSTTKRISALITLSIQKHFALLNLQKKSAAPGSVAAERFSNGLIEAQRIAVSASSSLVGKSLKKSDLRQRSGLGVSIAVATTKFEISETRIMAGDLVTIFGPSQSVNSERQRLAPERYQNT